MGRPLGSKNKSPRELIAEGKHRIEKGKYKDKIEKLNEKLKKKK